MKHPVLQIQKCPRFCALRFYYHLMQCIAKKSRESFSKQCFNDGANGLKQKKQKAFKLEAALGLSHKDEHIRIHWHPLIIISLLKHVFGWLDVFDNTTPKVSLHPITYLKTLRRPLAAQNQQMVIYVFSNTLFLLLTFFGVCRRKNSSNNQLFQPQAISISFQIASFSVCCLLVCSLILYNMSIKSSTPIIFMF